jgi:hypothetical protein
VKTRPFLIGSAILVAVLAAASFYIATTIDKFDRSMAVAASPDGKFKAIKVTVAGGGATPFCFDTVSVMLAVYPDDSVDRRKEYEIYSALCGTFADGGKSPKIEWLSHSALQITYAAVPPVSDARPPRTRDIDVTKSVHITVVGRE